MNKLSKVELSKMSIAQYCRLNAPKFKLHAERGFWLDTCLRELNELYPGKGFEYWTDELLKSPQILRWITEDDFVEAVKWIEYCNAHNH